MSTYKAGRQIDPVNLDVAMPANLVNWSTDPIVYEDENELEVRVSIGGSAAMLIATVETPLVRVNFFGESARYIFDRRTQITSKDEAARKKALEEVNAHSVMEVIRTLGIAPMFKSVQDNAYRQGVIDGRKQKALEIHRALGTN